MIAQQIYYRYFHGQTNNEAYARFGPAAQYLEAPLQPDHRQPDGSGAAGPARPGVLGRRRLRRALGDRVGAVAPARPGARRTRGRRRPSSSTARCAGTARPPRLPGSPSRATGRPRLGRVRPPRDARRRAVARSRAARRPARSSRPGSRRPPTAGPVASTTRATTRRSTRSATGSRPRCVVRRRRRGSGTAVVLTSGGPTSWAVATPARCRSRAGGRVRLWRRLNPVCVNSGVTKARDRPARPDPGVLQRAHAPRSASRTC